MPAPKCSVIQAQVARTCIPFTEEAEAGGSSEISLSCTVRHTYVYLFFQENNFSHKKIKIERMKH